MAFIADVKWYGDVPSVARMECQTKGNHLLRFWYCSSSKRLLKSYITGGVCTEEAEIFCIKKFGKANQQAGVLADRRCWNYSRSSEEQTITIRFNDYRGITEFKGEESFHKMIILEYLAKKADAKWDGEAFISDAYVVDMISSMSVVNKSGNGEHVTAASPAVAGNAADVQDERLQVVTVRYISGDVVGTFGLSKEDNVSLLRRQVQHAVGEDGGVRLFYQQRMLKDKDALGCVLPADDAEVYVTQQVAPVVTDDVIFYAANDGVKVPTGFVFRSVRQRVPTGFVMGGDVNIR